MIRLKQFVNPNIVKKAIWESFVLAFMLFEISFFLHLNAIVVFLLAFVILFFIQYAYAPNAFKIVVLDENGIRCGKTHIKWSSVRTIHDFVGYVDYKKRNEILGETRSGDFDGYSCGKMIGFNTSNNEDFSDTKDKTGIYIYCGKKVNQYLYDHCEKYKERYGKNSLAYQRASSKNGELCWCGNPRVILFALSMNLIVVLASWFIFSAVLSFNYFKAFLSVLPLHISIWLFFIYHCKDAFSFLKFSEDGILCQESIILWNDIAFIKEYEPKMRFGLIQIRCGNILGINTQYSDFYLGRHSHTCFYAYKTKKLERCFEKYLGQKKFEELQI